MRAAGLYLPAVFAHERYSGDSAGEVWRCGDDGTGVRGYDLHDDYHCKE